MYDYKKKIEKGFKHLGIWVIRCRLLILLLTVTVAGAAITQLPKLSIATSVETLFSRDDKLLTDYQWFRGQFGRDENIVLLVSAGNIFSGEFLSKLKWFHADLEKSVPLLKEVRSLANAPYITSTDSGVRAGWFLDTLPRTDEESIQFRKRALAYPGFKNQYFTPDGKHAMVVIKTQAVSALTPDGKRLRDYARGVPGAVSPPQSGEQPSISQVENIAVIAFVEAVIKQYRDHDFRIAFSGTPVYQYHVEPMIRANMIKMCLTILFVPLLLMPIVFGRGSGAFFPQITTILGLLVALGLMALLSVRFSYTSSMLPSIILSIGLTAPIHFLVVFYKFQNRAGKFRGIIATMQHSGFPITMTSLTTVAGLMSFSFSDIAPIADLVNFTIIGILAILLFTLFSLPAILSILQVVEGVKQGEANYKASIFNRSLQALGRLGISRPRPVFYVFLVVTILAAINLPRLHFSHNELHYFERASRFMRQVRFIERETGGFRALEVMIDTQREKGIIDHDLLEAFERLDVYMRAKTDDYVRPFVGRTRSTADLIKEVACDPRLKGHDACKLPTDRDVLTEQFDHLNRLVPETLLKYTDADLSMGRLTAMMYWRDAANDVDFVNRVKKFAAALFDSGAKVAVTGVAAINSGILDAMMTSLAVGYGTGFVLITLLMVVAIGDVRLGLLAMIPNLFPIVIGLGVMGFLKIPLNTYNLIGGSIAIGLAVDDTIHFFHNFRRYYLQTGDISFAVRETLGSAGRALLATTMVLVASFWMRLFSNLKVVADFGLVMGIALLVAFLADVLLAPALLRIYYGVEKTDPREQIDVKNPGQEDQALDYPQGACIQRDSDQRGRIQADRI